MEATPEMFKIVEAPPTAMSIKEKPRPQRTGTIIHDSLVNFHINGNQHDSQKYLI